MSIKHRMTALAMFAAVGCAVQPTHRAVQAPVPVTVHQTMVAAHAARPHPSVSQQWLRFREQRSAHLETLAAPLLECANAKPKQRTPECNRRMETFELPYALAALHRVTHEQRFADAAEKAFDRKWVAKHQRFDAYTSAWFLEFARERELGTRITDLRVDADAVAARLETALTDLDDYGFAQAALFGSENNMALTLGSLWRWADHRLDTSMSARLESYAKTRVLGTEMDSWCPMRVDAEPDNSEFLPPCLQRAATVLEVMPEQISNRWLRDFVAVQNELEPIRNARLGTHAALNFARAWNLWTVYLATGDGAYRDEYVTHMESQLGDMARAKKNQEPIDPWLATFGVRALVASDAG